MWFQPYYGTFAEAEDNFAHLTQTVAGSPGVEYTLKGWALFENHFPGGRDNLNQPGTDVFPPDDGPLSPTDTFFALEFLDVASAVLPGSVEIELKADSQMNDTQWKEHTLVAVAPAGTTSVRVRASMIDGVLNEDADPQSFLVDAFSLTAAAPPPVDGDFDGDFDVDGADFLIWQRGGSPTPHSPADLADWRANFGPPAVAATSAVPELTSGVLLAMALGGLLAAQRIFVDRRR